MNSFTCSLTSMWFAQTVIFNAITFLSAPASNLYSSSCCLLVSTIILQEINPLVFFFPFLDSFCHTELDCAMLMAQLWPIYNCVNLRHVVLMKRCVYGQSCYISLFLYKKNGIWLNANRRLMRWIFIFFIFKKDIRH